MIVDVRKFNLDTSINELILNSEIQKNGMERLQIIIGII